MKEFSNVLVARYSLRGPPSPFSIISLFGGEFFLLSCEEKKSSDETLFIIKRLSVSHENIRF